MKALSILSLIAVLFVSACQKENFNPQLSSNSNSNHAFRMSHSNPYELAGQSHNRYLDIISTEPQFPKHTREELYSTISVLAAKDFPGTEKISFKDLEGVFNTDLTQACRQMQSKQLLTEKQHQSLLQLAQIFESPNSNRQTIITRIEALEKNTISRNDMAENDKVLILGSTATARYSVEYWHEAYTNRSNKWFHVLHGNAEEPAGLPKWVKVALADVGGFLVGGASATVIVNDGNFHFDLGLAVLGATVASGAAAKGL